MTDGSWVAPPPPPPPPPAPPSYQRPAKAFDFAKPFTFVFEDPRWITKILVGGLFFLLAFLIIGSFFIMGYLARLTRNVIAGVSHPMPEWDDLGTYFSEGLRLFAVALGYILPLVLFAIVFVIPGALLSGNTENEAIRNLGGCVLGGVWCVFVPLSLALTFFMPAALLMAIVHQRIGAAFEFGRIWAFIKANIGNYVLAIVVYLVANFVASFGYILLCVGILFTNFWSVVVTAYSFAEVYRLSEKK